MNMLYPLKFRPLFREKIWGGHKIREILGLDFGNLARCGEAWVLSGVPGHETVVANGFLDGNELNELVEVYMDDLVGGKVYDKFGNTFPVLVKFIDAREFLSIQVHPDDDLARKRGLGNGKNELWYIVDADEGSELICGFSKKATQHTFLEYLKNKKLPELMNFEKARAGDVFLMPAGRIHALGPGILLAEIQQTSDTTYRIYDWNRVDPSGQPREMHVEEALDAIDYNIYDNYRIDYGRMKNHTVELVNEPFFTTNLLDLTQPIEKDYEEVDSFVILTCVLGSLKIGYPEGDIDLKQGECALIPNELNKIHLKPSTESKLLETYIL